MALTQKRRPLPPIEFLEVDEIKFAPAVDLTDWARTAFITTMPRFATTTMTTSTRRPLGHFGLTSRTEEQGDQS